MSKYQSKLEQLIQQYCPNGVEFLSLSEVVNILDNQRKPISKSNRHSGEYPYYWANGIQDYVDDYIFDGIFLLLGEDGSVINKDWTPILNWATWKIWVNNHAHVLSEKSEEALLRYVFFALSVLDVTKVVKGNIPKITQTDLKNFQIPIPPLPVQQEIVRILDTFTELEAELEADLEARRSQYEYYRDQLLTFPRGGVQYKLLGEIGKISMCKRIFKNQTTLNGEIPFYKIGTFWKEPDAFISKKLYEEYRNNFSFPNVGDILLSASGTIWRRVLYDWKPAYFQDSNIIWFSHDETMVLNKYLYYLYEIIVWQTEWGTIKRLYNDNMKKILIPVPPLEKQKEIIAILDRFDALVNDITIGLPAEIAARRQQYEYYRNKLLTFQKIENAN